MGRDNQEKNPEFLNGGSKSSKEIELKHREEADCMKEIWTQPTAWENLISFSEKRRWILCGRQKEVVNSGG